MTKLSKQIHMRELQITTCCESIYGKLLPHLSGEPILSPINLLNHFDN